MSSGAQNDLAEDVFGRCNPQKVAKELMERLESAAMEAAGKGEHEALAYIYFWNCSSGTCDQNYKFCAYRGLVGSDSPFAYCDWPKRQKLFEILCAAVEKCIPTHISDANVSVRHTNSENRGDIYVYLEW